jgi:hypothetical protein
MSNQNRICPICYCEVARTKNNNIGGHLNTAGNPCEASYTVSYSHTLDQRKPRR